MKALMLLIIASPAFGVDWLIDDRPILRHQPIEQRSPWTYAPQTEIKVDGKTYRGTAMPNVGPGFEPGSPINPWVFESDDD